MKNKALIGGAIALAAIISILLLCFWSGKKINDWIRGTDETSVSKPENQPNNPPNAPTSSEQAQQIFLALGNPSNAAGNPNNYLLVNNYFALSYNRDKGIPNWAAWRISKAEVRILIRFVPRIVCRKAGSALRRVIIRAAVLIKDISARVPTEARQMKE